MKIESVSYELIPYGTATGDRALIVKVSPEKNGENYEDEAKAMLADLKAICAQDKVLNDQLELALIAKTQFYFAGDALLDPENAKTTSTFFSLISVESLNRQKNSVHVTQLHAPFLGFIGNPLYYTGEEQFYENFNYLVITCGLDGITEKNTADYYRDFAMIEISRHKFASFAFKIRGQEDIDLFEKFYRARNVVNIDPRRIYFIPASTEPELVDLVASFCLKTGYRFGLDYAKYTKFAKSV